MPHRAGSITETKKKESVSMQIEDHTLLSREKFNAKLVALYLFQYSLLIPVMAFVVPAAVVAVCGIFIIAMGMFTNKLQIRNFKIVVFILIMLFVLLLKMLQPGSSYMVIVYFLTIAGPGLYLMSVGFDSQSFLDFCGKLAVVNFLINWWNPFWSAGYEYMRFGYGMVPTVIFSYYIATSENTGNKAKGFFYKMLFIVSLAEVAVFGARGSFLAVLMYLAIDCLFVQKSSLQKTVWIFGGVLLYFFLPDIVELLISILSSFGKNSYSLKKIKMQLDSGFDAASSGRSQLYQNALYDIEDHPFLGNPITMGVEDNYVHNLFLEVTQEFGVIALVVLILFILGTVLKLSSKKTGQDHKIILNCLFSIAIGRLLFSSTLWKRPEFWLYVGFALLISERVVSNGRTMEGKDIRSL